LTPELILVGEQMDVWVDSSKTWFKGLLSKVQKAKVSVFLEPVLIFQHNISII
jgi:hypothetical protein